MFIIQKMAEHINLDEEKLAKELKILDNSLKLVQHQEIGARFIEDVVITHKLIDGKTKITMGRLNIDEEIYLDEAAVTSVLYTSKRWNNIHKILYNYFHVLDWDTYFK